MRCILIFSGILVVLRLDKRMKRTIEIVLDLGPNIPKTLIDEGQIAQVFINIFLNALDAMPNGGTLTVASRLLPDGEGAGAIAVSFSDTGTGITPEHLEKIFDPFLTTKEAGKGTGLGLSVSYDIAKRFKGDIKVTSEPGKGTTFTVLLPVQVEQHKEHTND